MIEGNWQVEVRIFVDPGEPVFFRRAMGQERPGLRCHITPT